ncbi:hypothetical protein [Streptomyces ipomoeae]
MELQAAQCVLLCRLPRLQLAVDEAEILRKTGMQVRGPMTLLAQW